MKRIKAFLTSGLLVCCLAALAKVTIVVEKNSANPVEGATVFSNSGRIIGQTNGNGAVEVPQGDFPITVRCMGYDAVTGGKDADTLRLSPREYAMDTVTVSAKDRPVTRVIGFVREYTTGATTTDTTYTFNEYMAELFLAPHKTKGYKDGDSHARIRNKRSYQRIAHANGTDSISKGGEDALAMVEFLLYMPNSFSVPERMKKGATVDQIPGKYAPKSWITNNGRLFKVKMDPLSDYKDHKLSPWILKLMGFSMDMTKIDINYIYRSHADTTAYLPNELLEASVAASVTGNGKWIKKIYKTKDPILMLTFMEFYPVDVSRVTIDEYKELRDSKAVIPWADSPSVPPLQPAYEELKRRCESLPQTTKAPE